MKHPKLYGRESPPVLLSILALAFKGFVVQSSWIYPFFYVF